MTTGLSLHFNPHPQRSGRPSLRWSDDLSAFTPARGRGALASAPRQPLHSAALVVIVTATNRDGARGGV